MELVNNFSVDAPIDIAWKSLLDIPLVVDCLPGATLTAQLSPTSYKGNIRVRLGPIVMQFAGVLTLETSDDTPYVAVITAKWNETKNRGSASSVSRLTVASTEASVERSDVEVKTDVQLAGQVAQYGRGVGIIHAVANELVRQFVVNLQAALSQRSLDRQPPTVSSPPLAVAPQVSAVVAAALPEPATLPVPPPSPRRAPKEISTMPLLWAVFKAKVRALFAHA
jgi:uncharacterized protein